MNGRIKSTVGVALACWWSVSALPAAAAPGETLRSFEGSDDTRSLEISVERPWDLLWRVEGDKSFPSLSRFTVYLWDAEKGRFLGVVTDMTGSGWGRRHLPDQGRFVIDVVGRNVDWSLEVIDVAYREDQPRP